MLIIKERYINREWSFKVSRLLKSLIYRVWHNVVYTPLINSTSFFTFLLFLFFFTICDNKKMHFPRYLYIIFGYVFLEPITAIVFPSLPSIKDEIFPGFATSGNQVPRIQLTYVHGVVRY